LPQLVVVRVPLMASSLFVHGPSAVAARELVQN
jgi:hypothetical protein